MKKRLAVLLSAVLALTMFGGQFTFAASGDQFEDVDAGAWYKADVDYVAENGYMIGTSDTTFEPQSNLTRAMFATILARYDGAEVDDSKATIFTDVEVGQWFTGSIGWANEKEIVNGIGDNKFAPDKYITRQDLAVMVERYIAYVESTTELVHVTPGKAIPFTDADQISDYAKDAMDKAVIHGLIIGYPDKSVKPRQNITRAETAAVIHRIKWQTSDGKEEHVVTGVDSVNNKELSQDTVKTGNTYTVPEGPEKAGYTFKEWNTKKDGTGTSYNPGDKILLTEDLTLYAIYTKNSSGGGGGGTGGQTTVPLPVSEDDNPGNNANVPVVKTKDSQGNTVYKAPDYKTVASAKYLNIDPSKIKCYMDPKTGIIYHEGDLLPEEVLEHGLVVLLKSNYTVTVELQAAGAGPYTLTARYSDEEADATDLTTIAGDVIKDFTDFEGNKYNNKLFLTNLIEGAVTTKAKDRDAQKFGNYTISTKADGTIHAEEVSLADQLNEETEHNKGKMDKVRSKSGIQVSDSVWNEFVDAFSPNALFDANGSDLKLKDTDGYYAAIEKAVTASDNLRQAIGDAATFEKVLKASEEAGGSALLNTHFATANGKYELLGKSFDSPTELSSVNAKAAALLEKGNNDVLFELMKDKGEGAYTVFSAQETINSVDDVVTIMNDRVSRNWTQRDDIQSVLKALENAYKGAYSMVVKVEKTAI